MNRTPDNKDITSLKKKLYRATMDGKWTKACTILRHHKNALQEIINNNGETIVHIAVGTQHELFVRKLFYFIEDTEILKEKSVDGSTALHIAAITGNRYAAGLLIQKMESLVETRDDVGHLPYVVAYLNHQFDTSVFLFITTYKNMQRSLHLSSIDCNLLVDLVSTQQYDLALELMEVIPDLVVEAKAEVLMALARNFPSGLNVMETCIYPSVGNIRERMVNKTSLLFTSLGFFKSEATNKPVRSVFTVIILMLNVFVGLWILVHRLISFVIWIVYVLVLMCYLILWKVAKLIVAPIKLIEMRKKELENAKTILDMVCNKIDESDPLGTRHSLYKGPILEAASKNAYVVVAEILSRSPEAIRWKDRKGYDILSLAVVHYSDEIFKLIYQRMDFKSLCRTDIGSSRDNILHLAGRLSPSSKNSRNPALELQKTLKLREELRQLVPTLMYHKNMYEETPDMVFTMEHQSLLMEGETWIKATANSCSIIVALIATIGFAAAITVPGRSNQETGIPLFRKEKAFVIFAISDTSSLTASVTSLLMYLSILTSPFAEKDFLIRLPRKLLICLCSLFLSTVTIIVAFLATVYLVFADRKIWMISPICALILTPVYVSMMLIFSLIIDLFRSTYVPIFPNKNYRHISFFLKEFSERVSYLRGRMVRNSILCCTS